jgi:CBS domain-containing protein
MLLHLLTAGFQSCHAQKAFLPCPEHSFDEKLFSRSERRLTRTIANLFGRVHARALRPIIFGSSRLRRRGYDHRNHSRAGTDVATIEPEASVRKAADWLRVRNIGALVVTSGNAVLGVISEREIVHALSRYGETVASMPVKEIMRYGVITVSPDESVSRVMHLMTRHRVRHMPVLRDGKLAGIISIGDVVKHRLEDLESETNVLRDAYMATR